MAFLQASEALYVTRSSNSSASSVIIHESLLKKGSTPIFLIGSWEELQDIMEEVAYEVSSDPNVTHMEPIQPEYTRLDPGSFQQWAHLAPVCQHPQKALSMTQWLISPTGRGIHLPHLMGTHLRSFVCGCIHMGLSWQTYRSRPLHVYMCICVYLQLHITKTLDLLRCALA